ncbi:hypothetical protein Tco_0252075 [Tanacetum coccineum]
MSESEGSAGGHRKSKPKKQKSSVEDDLSQPWVCEETDPFTPRIRYFDFPRTRMPSHIKTYDGCEDPEDHLKIFQAVAKTERWAMPTWCHMFNSTLTGNTRVWFDDLPKESIDSYDDLRERYKLECRDVKGAPKCKKISGFMHGITYPELIKRLHDKIPKSVDEMMRVTTAFLRGEKGSFRNQQRTERKKDRFTLLTKTPKEVLALDKGKFKPPPPMTTPVEKRNARKFCEFHGEVGHTTDECEDSKKGGNLRELQVAGNINGTSMAEGSKTKNHSNFLLGVAIHPEYPEQTVAIGSTLTEEGRKELCGLLRRHLDVFVWKPADMTGVPWHIAKHRLNIREGFLPVRQKKRGKASERNKVICEEGGKLVDAGIMKEVQYHSWLSIPVMVKKTRRQLENVRGFERPKQGMPQRWLPVAGNRLESRIPLPIPFQMLPGCIQRIPPNTNGGRG